MVGRWTGPEGLFFEITKDAGRGPGHYQISNRYNLDDVASYDGIAEGDAIRFMRDGETLFARRGSGAQAGFKYLADKDDCLIVLPNREGYCR